MANFNGSMSGWNRNPLREVIANKAVQVRYALDDGVLTLYLTDTNNRCMVVELDPSCTDELYAYLDKHTRLTDEQVHFLQT